MKTFIRLMLPFILGFSLMCMFQLATARSAKADFWGSVAGGAIGGVIGGVISGGIQRHHGYRQYRPQYVPEQEYDPVGDCAARFRSYDPRTGFYRGYDGYLRRCP